MTELLNLLFNPLPNGVMTVLTGVSLLYWVFVLFSGEGLDFSTDADIHVDADSVGDVHDADGDGDVHHDHPGFFAKAMDFINVGKAPLMVIVTLFKFIGWIITIVSSLFISVGKFGYWSLLILIPIFIVTFFLMHWITKPIAKFYENVGYKGEDPHDYLGRTGVMKSSIQGEKIGLAEFVINKDVIRLNVRSFDGNSINYNDEIIVIDETKDKKIYLIQKDLNINNIK